MQLMRIRFFFPLLLLLSCKDITGIGGVYYKLAHLTKIVNKDLSDTIFIRKIFRVSDRYVALSSRIWTKSAEAAGQWNQVKAPLGYQNSDSLSVSAAGYRTNIFVSFLKRNREGTQSGIYRLDASTGNSWSTPLTNTQAGGSSNYFVYSLFSVNNVLFLNRLTLSPYKGEVNAAVLSSELFSYNGTGAPADLKAFTPVSFPGLQTGIKDIAYDGTEYWIITNSGTSGRLFSLPAGLSGPGARNLQVGSRVKTPLFFNALYFASGLGSGGTLLLGTSDNALYYKAKSSSVWSSYGLPGGSVLSLTTLPAVRPNTVLLGMGSSQINNSSSSSQGGYYEILFNAAGAVSSLKTEAQLKTAPGGFSNPNNYSSSESLRNSGIIGFFFDPAPRGGGAPLLYAQTAGGGLWMNTESDSERIWNRE